MAESADWSDLPSQLLSKIFGLQHTALDNCAAACTCASWRCACNTGHIAFLHLHAGRAFSYKNWSNFLVSKLSVGTLRLTASADFARNSIHDPVRARTFMQQIALICDHLDADEAFATELPYIALQPAQLKKLTVSLLCPSTVTASWSVFPDIGNLTQLTALHVRFNKHTCAPFGSETLSRVPESLKDLKIQGYNWRSVPPSIKPLIQPCLAFLEILTIEECRVTFVGSSITCLGNLTSFSDVNNLDKLTKLTCLDLTKSIWLGLSPRTGNPSPLVSRPFASFTGWPDLKVLKAAGCNLFHPSTKLDLPGVQTLQVS